jgi:hypothetical protein
MMNLVMRLLAFGGAVLIGAYYINVLFGLPGGEGFRTAPNPYLSGLLALALLYLVYVALSGDLAIWNAAVGEDGRASTSKFQVFLWTIVVIFGYVAIVTHRIQLGFAPPLPGFPESVLLALGLSIGTATAAAAVTANNLNSGKEIKTQATKLGLAPIVQSDDGTPSLSKIQLVGWTFVGIGMFVAALSTTLSLTAAAGDDKFVLPDIDPTLLVLMGLGSAAYIGTKLVPSTATQIASASVSIAKPGDTVIVKGVKFGTSGYIQVGGATIQSGVAWGDGEVTFVVPQKMPDGSDWPTDKPLELRVFGSLGQSVNYVPITIQP